MNRLYRTTLMPPTVVVVALLALGSMACASGPRPQVLQDANELLATQKAQDLGQDQPRLMNEARRYLGTANEAYDEGDPELAELYAHVALNRYRTSQNLISAGSARRKAVLLKRQQRGEEAEDESGEPRIQVNVGSGAEQARFDRLEDRIERIREQLEQDDGDSPAMLSAKRALAKARRKQSDAIGADAPRLARVPYREGASHVEHAVESIELGIYGESKISSERAAAAFERAIQQAERSADGERRKGADDSRARDKAEQALTQAARARAGALAAGGGIRYRTPFRKAEALHDSAREAFERQDYPGARRLALDAVRSYEEAAAGGAGGASGGSGFAGLGSGFGSVMASPERIEALIVALQFKRAEMLGQRQNESCPAVFKEFEAIVALAAERLQAGDLAHAGEFAVRAQERVRRCEAPWSAVGTAKSEQVPDRDALLAKDRAARALRQAQSELARAIGQNPTDPKVRQGETLIRNAEQWFDRGSFKEAESLAKTAEAALRTVRAAVAGRDDDDAGPRRDAAAKIAEAQRLLAQVERHLGPDDRRVKAEDQRIQRAQRQLDRGRHAQALSQAQQAVDKLRRLLRAEPRDDKPDQASPAERRAQKAIAKAEQAQVKALVRVEDPQKLRQPDRLLELARKAFDGRAFTRAVERADEARRVYERLAKKPSKKPRSKAATCRQVRRKLDSAKLLARNTDGPHLAPREKRRHREAKSLLSEAALRLDRDLCSKAYDSVEQATDLLVALPFRPDADRGDRPDSFDAAGDREGDGRGEGGWQRAYDAAQRALRARDRARKVVTDDTRSTYRRGLTLLRASRDDYESRLYDEAERQANAAVARFDAVIEASGGEPTSTRTAPRLRTDRRDDSGEPAPTEPGRAGPESWRGPYYVVYGALAMRDRALASAKTAEHREAIARGQERLKLAENAWDAEDWPQAARHAKAAVAEFRQVFDRAAPTQGDTDGGDKSKGSEVDPGASYEQAEAAVREARVILQICERDQCDERDFAEFAKAKEMVASAERNLEAKRYGYAVKLGSDAREALSGILAKPRESKPAVDVDPAERQQAEEAIREAEVQRKLCEQGRNCRATDLEAFLRASGDLSAAQSALADGDAPRAGRLANKATLAFQAITAGGPTLEIPQDIQSVTRSGDQLYLQPPIKFRTGSANLTPEAKEVIRDLATVLKHNADVLSHVEILGFTDSRGNRAVNERVSGARARAVLRALVAAGVPSTLLGSAGRGPSDPIADNTTPEGRAANRRVEVHFQLQ